MKVKATTPRNWAIFGSSKYISPGPSDPASIPTIKNRISVGTPNLNEVLLAMMLAKSMIDPKSNIFSAVSVKLVNVLKRRLLP
ncbi:MAG: hypothetical protein BroJett042_11370 [Bacteroidota bacterium]|nr:MAG: hypothetical protein BroJett042_11370 [Bacteroidota bacterium]